MANEALSQIKEAEAQAQTLIKGAQEEATQIVARAEKEAEDALVQLNELCSRDATQTKRQAEAVARSASAAFVQETTQLCAALGQELSAQKPKAVDAVVKSVAGR